MERLLTGESVQYISWIGTHRVQRRAACRTRIVAKPFRAWRAPALEPSDSTHSVHACTARSLPLFERYSFGPLTDWCEFVRSNAAKAKRTLLFRTRVSRVPVLMSANEHTFYSFFRHSRVVTYQPCFLFQDHLGVNILVMNLRSLQ
jgi:hypothetical protein